MATSAGHRFGSQTFEGERACALPEILEQAKRAFSPDRLKKPAICSVCGAETSTVTSEPLCWVCRRLKISAWREIEQQMPAQE